ncbi:hypothetical protein ACFVXQ_03695 [Kitasatospora sp. NPDC058263]
MAYQLRVCDLRSDDVLDVLPIEQVTFDDYISRTGSLSGTIPLPNRSLAQRARAALTPGRTMLYLERATTFGTEIAWGGILWTRTPTMADRTLTMSIQAATIESYIRSHRILLTNVTYHQIDQLDIVRQMLDGIQGTPGGDIGIDADYSQLSGVLRDRTYLGADLHFAGELWDQLAACEDGFEWRVAIYRDAAGLHRKDLRLGYPQISITGEDLILDSPGPILAYSLPEDATTMANLWLARGASINQNQAVDSYPLMAGPLFAPEDWAAGWPQLDGSSNYPSTEEPDTLFQHAVADLARARQPVIIPTVSYASADARQPQLGSYVRLRIQDDWYPEMHSARYRIVGLRVAPEERGRHETTELYLEAA